MLHHVFEKDLLNYICLFLSLSDILNLTSANTTLRKRLPLLPLNLSSLCIYTSLLESMPTSFNVKKIITLLDAGEKVFTIPKNILCKLDSLTLGRSLHMIHPVKFNMYSVDISCVSLCCKLTYLEVDNTIILSELSMISKCSSLVSLSLGNCSTLSKFKSLPNTLQSITLRRAYLLSNLKGIRKCTQLVQLTIDQCYKLVDVSLLTKFTQLESITIKFANELVDISALWQCTKLKKVVLENCPKLIATLPKNIVYDIFDCPGVADNT